MINTIKNELLLFIKGYFRGEYPDYIFKKKLNAEIPVFIYHHIKSEEFEKRLQFLKNNNYHTLTADELEQAQKKRDSTPERSVVITFDDGLSDVYSIAYPLLKKYDLKAVVFLLPGWIGSPGVVSWDQVQEMHQSGVIDFQSHSMYHPAIFTAPKLIDFYNPRYSNVMPWNIPLTQTKSRAENSFPPQWGTPIYKYLSRFSDARRYYPDLQLQERCTEHVANNGGEDFFKRKEWRKELLAIVEKHNSGNDSFELENLQRASILKELRTSKQKIEEKLTNKTVRHFAWPWNQVGILTAELLLNSGYTTSFMGLSKAGINDDKLPALNFVKRVTGDFITCLPGEGRQSFWAVMLEKMVRRLKSGATY